MKNSILTTFNKDGYEKYGHKMLSSFDSLWPLDIDIYAYYEGEISFHQYSKRIHLLKLLKHCPKLVEFKERHKNNPTAHGKIEPKTGFKWDAVRFAHKSYCITYASTLIDTDRIFWIDADVITHSPVPNNFLETVLPSNYYCSFLGREPLFSETGFLGFNCKHQYHKEFMNQWMDFYNSDKIFMLKEWHDCEVFDTVRRKMSTEKKILAFDLAKDLGIVKGHPFINSILGTYMDHLKGPRKDKGTSHKSDLKIIRKEKYWQNVK